MEPRTERLAAILTIAPVIPVLVIESPKAAVPLARALVAGGLKAIEVTLRTRAALDALRAIADEVEGAVVGAGTVLTVVERGFGTLTDPQAALESNRGGWTAELDELVAYVESIA